MCYLFMNVYYHMVRSTIPRTDAHNTPNYAVYQKPVATYHLLVLAWSPLDKSCAALLRRHFLLVQNDATRPSEVQPYGGWVKPLDGPLQDSIA